METTEKYGAVYAGLNADSVDGGTVLVRFYMADLSGPIQSASGLSGSTQAPADMGLCGRSFWIVRRLRGEGLPGRIKKASAHGCTRRRLVARFPNRVFSATHRTLRPCTVMPC